MRDDEADAAGAAPPAAPAAAPGTAPGTAPGAAAAAAPAAVSGETPADEHVGDVAQEVADRDAGARQHPLVRAGMFAWALLGFVAVAVVVGFVLIELAVVVVPLVLALFPAAVLVPPVVALRRRGLPPGLAAGVTILGMLLGVGLLVRVLAPIVAAELEGLGEALARGYEQVASFLASGPFGMDPVRVDDVVEQARERLFEGGSDLGARALEAGVAVAEGFAGLALGLFALFFYLKDGERIGTWLRDLFPVRLRDDAEEIGQRAWYTIGAYIRGQLLVAFVDALFIGIGIALVGVPLALPLAVIVFAASLFPIVGALVSGALAVLVALTISPFKALLVLLIVVAVQQLESHLLAPVVLGRATALHPLAVITALASGGILLGVLGAFIAVPIAASLSRAVGYWRTRIPG